MYAGREHGDGDKVCGLNNSLLALPSKISPCSLNQVMSVFLYSRIYTCCVSPTLLLLASNNCFSFSYRVKIKFKRMYMVYVHGYAMLIFHMKVIFLAIMIEK